MRRDDFGRRLINEDELCQALYYDPKLDLSTFNLEDPSKHNSAVMTNYSELSKIARLESLGENPISWHKHNQEKWWMPDEYRDMDIAAWLLSQCQGETELQRCGMELLRYAEKDLLCLLSYLKYLVDIMRANGIVWGVGRGSSVASFVLYKIGVHKINPLIYDLDFDEFMR